MFLRGILFPGSIEAEFPATIFCPTAIPLVAITYRQSPSTYLTNAILADLFGSYSIETTSPETSFLERLKSIILNLLLCPPPLCLTVILPAAFLPAFLFKGLRRDFFGLEVVRSSEE